MNLFIFGGTGDLAKRKLLPALYRHFKAERLSKDIKIYGIGSKELQASEYHEEIKVKLSDNLDSVEYDAAVINEFIKKISYIKIDFNKKNDFVNLKKNTSNTDRNLYYLAVSPLFYKVIAENLNDQDIIGPLSSIIVEKPIGNDLQSSIDINESLALYFNEHQIFRIDHYLGKEAVQNLLALRFGNILFEKIWSNVAVDHIQITVAETLGLENRGSYYDQTGAIKDMLQNHLLQILCLVAMEPPTNINSESIRDEKLKVLRSLRPFKTNETDEHLVIGQYKEGAIDAKAITSYLDENGVNPKSQTETFVALKLWIDNWRWSGVPFFLRTGKRMAEKRSEIVIQFKSVPHNIFDSNNKQKDNQLVIRLQPEESIKLKIMIKKPSASGFSLQELPLDLLFDDYYEDDHLDAYERLLMDIIDNKPSLFMRRDEVENAWSYIDQLIHSISESEIKLSKYNAGSWGPSSSDLLIASHNAKWNNEED
ncbi:MAG: glucose-6-phosphate dehydrogenase [SAR86 cluster bacterium]|nr:glucose-6-phosphate dehydrogenase [SAR86 cluster bacterium]